MFPQFVDDLFVRGGVSLVSVPPEDMRELVDVMAHYNLDFDDAYQYVVATEFDADIVSFDGDLDRTDRGRVMPSGVLAE